MKTSLRKLRGFGLHRQAESRERRDRRFQRHLVQLDELAKAAQDMQDMRDCYDSLLSAAAATSNSAYEFSESLREIGACLLEKTALNDDEESGRVLLMLGKVQFELQKLFDKYRSHISRTITRPSESLLNELRIVEEMKRQCDEKRDVYEHMITRQREKGRLRTSRGETFSSQQLQAAHDEYDEEATLFLFRLKSLKEGQSRSLLTQAARHHAAQLCFFKKALNAIETVDPHVKSVTESQHIDYQFSGLEDDYGNDGDNYDDEDSDSYDMHDDSELSFDYGQNDGGHDFQTSRNSMELDHEEIVFPQVATVDVAKENIDSNPYGGTFTFGKDLKAISQSAPLFAEKKVDPAERFRQMRQLSSRKFNTYVLPTPAETKNLVSTGSDFQVPQIRRTRVSESTLNVWHSSPLEPKKYEKILGGREFSGPISSHTYSVLKESNTNTRASRLPPPLAERISLPQLNQHATSDSKKIKRQSFSGPLSNKSWSNKSGLYASGPLLSKGHHQLFSGPLLRSPLPQQSSPPKVSPSASPTFVSSPKISELHELPRPPPNLASKSAVRSSYLPSHWSPLSSKGQESSATSKVAASNAASPLPAPPQALPRSFSIPSRDQRATTMSLSNTLETPHDLKMTEDSVSPPLTPIALSKAQQSSSASEAIIPAVQSRVDAGADLLI